MPDGDCIGAHQNFLDQEPNDFSASNQIQVFSVAVQSCTEVVEVINYAQISRLILSGHVQGL